MVPFRPRFHSAILFAVDCLLIDYWCFRFDFQAEYFLKRQYLMTSEWGAKIDQVKKLWKMLIAAFAAFTQLLLSKPQSKTQRLFIRSHNWQRRATDPYMQEDGTRKCRTVWLIYDRGIVAVQWASWSVCGALGWGAHEQGTEKQPAAGYWPVYSLYNIWLIFYIQKKVMVLSVAKNVHIHSYLQIQCVSNFCWKWV